MDELPTTKTAHEYAVKIRQDILEGKHDWCIALRLVHFYEDFNKALNTLIEERRSA